MTSQTMTDPKPGMNPAFRIRDLRKVYDTGLTRVEALRGVNLDLYAGTLSVLLGPSGSGKSTLLNIMGGLDLPTSGQVFFQDLEITALDEAGRTEFRRHQVGFVFQFYNLIPSLTAEENVELVTEIADDPMSAALALDLVGLGERRNHFPAELSGGEQQRVAISRAIAKRPHVLLCDEPTGALDSATGTVVLQALERINAEIGTTTVLITHNASVAAMADTVVTFGDGTIVSVTENEHRIPAEEITW